MTTDPAEAAVVDAVPNGLLIGGTWRPANSGRTFTVEDPSTEAVLCTVADADATDAVAALDAAVAAQSAWAAVAPASAARSCGERSTASRRGSTSSRS